MPHRCVRCGKIYPDGSKELLSGCECGCRFFLFIKKEHMKEAEEIIGHLTEKEKKQIEKDVLDIIGPRAEEDKDAPIILDLESIRISKPGKYEIDLVKLFKENPIVYKLEEGKYIIDVATILKKKK